MEGGSQNMEIRRKDKARSDIFTPQNLSLEGERQEVENQKNVKVRVGLSSFEFCTGGAEGGRQNCG